MTGLWFYWFSFFCSLFHWFLSYLYNFLPSDCFGFNLLCSFSSFKGGNLDQWFETLLFFPLKGIQSYKLFPCKCYVSYIPQILKCVFVILQYKIFSLSCDFFFTPVNIKRVLFHFQILGIFLALLLFLVSNLIVLWSENKLSKFTETCLWSRM